MPTPLIPTYGIWSATHLCTGSTHECTITMGYQNTSGALPSLVNSAIRTPYVNAAGPWSPANNSNKWSLIRTQVIQNIAGVLQTDVNVTVTPGTNSAIDPSPINTAILVNKNTGIAGRHYRGRMFAPPAFTAEANIDAAGNISGAQVTAMNTAWMYWYNQIVLAGYTPVIMHANLSFPTAITSLSVSSRIGTLKRRMRR